MREGIGPAIPAGAAKSAIDNPAWNRAPMTDEKPRKSTKLVWIVWRDAVGGDRIHRDDIARARLAVNTVPVPGCTARA